MTFIYEDLPLLTTSDLGVFSQENILPVVYGDMSSSLVPMARISDTEFALAGAVQGVTAVWVNDTRITAFVVSTEFMDSGKPYTKITLSRTTEQRDKVSASLYGRVSSRTGRLLENPADIMEDILAMAGIDASFDLLRSECSSSSIRLAGAITTRGSVQSHLDVVAQSCGAVWCVSVARLYPAPQSRGIANIEPLDITDLKLDTPSEGYASKVKLSYDFNYYNNQPSRTMELTASPYNYDNLLELSLPMVRNAAIAEAIGRRLLERLASTKFSVSLTIPNRKVTTLDWININHPDLPLNVLGIDYLPLMVLSSDKSLDVPTNYLEGEIIVSSPLAIRVTNTSYEQRLTENALVVTTYQPTTQQLTVLVTQTNNTPLSHVKVSLDGGTVLYTDITGSVILDASTGAHTLYVQATGLISYKVELFL